jgi:hypothetical protein
MFTNEHRCLLSSCRRSSVRNGELARNGSASVRIWSSLRAIKCRRRLARMRRLVTELKGDSSRTLSLAALPDNLCIAHTNAPPNPRPTSNFATNTNGWSCATSQCSARPRRCHMADIINKNIEDKDDSAPRDVQHPPPPVPRLPPPPPLRPVCVKRSRKNGNRQRVTTF